MYESRAGTKAEEAALLEVAATMEALVGSYSKLCHASQTLCDPLVLPLGSRSHRRVATLSERMEDRVPRVEIHAQEATP